MSSDFEISNVSLRDLRQAAQFGFDKDEYLASVRDVKIAALDDVEKTMSFLHDLAGVIVSTVKDKIKLIGHSRELE